MNLKKKGVLQMKHDHVMRGYVILWCGSDGCGSIRPAVSSGDLCQLLQFITITHIYGQAFWYAREYGMIGIYPDHMIVAAWVAFEIYRTVPAKHICGWKGLQEPDEIIKKLPVGRVVIGCEDKCVTWGLFGLYDLVTSLGRSEQALMNQERCSSWVPIGKA